MARQADKPFESFQLPDDDGVCVGHSPRLHWCKGHGRRARTGIVVLPIQGGNYEVSSLFAAHFARKGFAVLRFERRAEWLVAKRPPEALGELLEAYVEDVRKGVSAWLERVPEVEETGLFGVSMGAMVATLVAAAEPSFSRVVLVMGGGPLGDILATAHDREINAFRRELAGRLGLSNQDLRTLLRTAIGPLDPLAAASSLEGEKGRILCIQSRFDRVVRYRTQVRLWEALGRPARRVLPCGHYWAVLFVPWIKRAAVRWFDHLLRS
jgi:pimeloyl-ACP methyl ester carboxylesterase